ncbi:MAG: type II toxin-antitoxin system HicB family antitoxin [Planctomycetes bacterium]|nr:type II toxin-antitoxin system HicB family antitoxin [Planctomycetota bacterium]
MMEYKGYLARTEFDDEANVFHGEVINIRDVITFQGKSVDELRQALKDSVEDYFAFCAQRGEKPERPFAGPLTVRLSPQQQRQVVLAAEKAGKRIERWIAEVLTQAASLGRRTKAGKVA